MRGGGEGHERKEKGSPWDGANAGELTHEALLRCLVMSVGKPLSKF